MEQSITAKALILTRGGGLEPSVDSLILAAARDDGDQVNSLLDRGVDINGRG